MLKKLMGLALLSVVALSLTLTSLPAMANHKVGHNDKQPCACCKVCKCEPVCNCPKA